VGELRDSTEEALVPQQFLGNVADVHRDLDSIRQFVEDRWGHTGIPRYIWIVEALPKGPSGKILKCEICRSSTDTPETASPPRALMQ
jgi:acyl-CoA synthetase (AMP-forming)/AMP-acid ligase II